MCGAAVGRSAGCIELGAAADSLASISPERRCFMGFSSFPPRDGMSTGCRAWSVLTGASKRVFSLARDSCAKASSSVVTLWMPSGPRRPKAFYRERILLRRRVALLLAWQSSEAAGTFY
jgi:hypothetical protein